MARSKGLPAGLIKRGQVYHANFQYNGRRVRKKLATNLNVATQMLNDLRARVFQDDYGALDNNVPLSEIKEEYLTSCEDRVRPSTFER